MRMLLRSPLRVLRARWGGEGLAGMSNLRQPRLFWVSSESSRLAIAARPVGGEVLRREIQVFRDAGIDVLVSLLTRDEILELCLQEAPACCNACGIEFANLSIEDRGVPPDLIRFNELVKRLKPDLDTGKSIAIHCRAGIGRSGLVAACVLAQFEFAPVDAFVKISKARGCIVPDTDEQRAFAEAYWAKLAKER